MENFPGFSDNPADVEHAIVGRGCGVMAWRVFGIQLKFNFLS
jgi:hypothetical protein